MLDHIKLEHGLVFDVETVCCVEHYDELPADMQKLWQEKAQKLGVGDESPEESFWNYAGIYAEFGKVVCISAGFFTKDPATGGQQLRISSFASKDEKELLAEFARVLNKHYGILGKHYLCGHNIKEFDVPYVCRRMLINEVELPTIMDMAGKKPWEVIHVDTMELWKFGDYKSYTSLKLLAALFGIPTPKDDIEGKDVTRVFWEEDDLPRIVTYCQKDVLTTARLLLRYKGMETLSDEQVFFINS